MLSNRLCQSFNSIHLRRNAASIYYQSFHTNFNGRHNLSVVKTLEPSHLASSKCRPLYAISFCSSVRRYSLTSTPDNLGEVRLLRGVRGDLQAEVNVPTPFQCGNYIFKLTAVLNQVSLKAIFEFMSGFEQGFIVYTELLRQRNPNDLERDWLQPTAQEDTKDIINRLPADCWEVVENHGFLVPFCIGYKVCRDENPPSVDAAILFPCVIMPSEKKLFWHIVYTRKFGEGVIDSWSIKNVAVFIL